MDRNKLLGIIIGVAVVIGLAVWGFGRERVAADEQPAADGSDTDQPRAKPNIRRASLRPAPDAEPKATIVGTVRDTEGQPIAGAQVCAWPRIQELEGLAAATPPCAKTEADGRYRLEGLFPVRAVVNAEARGYLPQRWFGRHETHREEYLTLAAGQTREGVDFTLRPGGVEVHAVVRDISGGVIEGAFVWVGSMGFEESGRSAGRSDADGRVSLWTVPGRLSVYAEAEGYAPDNRYSAAPGPTVEVTLTPESVIVGRVVLAGTDEPVSGVAIDARGEIFVSDGRGQGRSDDAGEFRIAGLEPGIYTLQATGDQLYGEAPELVHLGLAETAEDVVIELHPGFMVSGRIVLAGGAEPRPCPQGFVRLADRTEERNDRIGRVTAGGEVELRALLPGTYEVTVNCDGTIPKPEYPDIVIEDANVSGQVWEVDEGLAIRGEVVDAKGSPVDGMQVLVTMKTDPNTPREQMTREISEPTLEDGQFAVLGLLPGPYELRLIGNERPSNTETMEIVLTPGADVEDIRLELPGDGTITGIVRDADGQPVPAVQLMAKGADPRHRAVAVTDDEGRFVLEHLTPGEVRISAMDGMAPLRAPGTTDDDEQGTVVQVEVDQTTEVEIIIESRKATLRGRVLDEHGSPVADAFVSHQRVLDSAKAGKGRGKMQMRWGFDSQPVLTDTDGSFVIDGLADDGTYMLGAFRKGGGEAFAENVEAGTTVELTITATGTLAGKVVVEGGELPDRVKLTIRNDAAALTRHDDLFRTGGAFRLEELPAGTYTLIADSAAGVARLEGVELEAGETRDGLVLSLAPRVTVRGRVIDIDTREPIPGMSVSVGARGTSMSFRSEDAGELAHVSDAEGRFTVANAQTGKVTIAIMPRALRDDIPYSWLYMPFVIPTGEDVVDIGDIELVANRVERGQKPGDIGFEIQESDLGAEPEAFVATVALIRPGGPAEGSGLAVGDRIETVNGHDVEGINSARFSRLTRVPPGTSVELGLAGGKNVTITAGPPSQ